MRSFVRIQLHYQSSNAGFAFKNVLCSLHLLPRSFGIQGNQSVRVSLQDIGTKCLLLSIPESLPVDYAHAFTLELLKRMKPKAYILTWHCPDSC